MVWSSCNVIQPCGCSLIGSCRHPRPRLSLVVSALDFFHLYRFNNSFISVIFINF